MSSEESVQNRNNMFQMLIIFLAFIVNNLIAGETVSKESPVNLYIYEHSLTILKHANELALILGFYI